MAGRFIVVIILQSLWFCISCSPARISYFKDVADTSFNTRLAAVEAPIEPGDILSITITSLNAEASRVFNVSNNNESRVSTSTGGAVQSGGYLVNSDGYIQLPLLGKINALGRTKKQLKADITGSILEKKLLLDPIVEIRHLNFEVTVIGEVAHPTVITVPNEQISLIKAIGLAGDLTIYGKRENVLLIREEGGKKITRHIDLTSESFFTSPYYYLQPNDVVYVEPNKTRVANASRSQQTWPLILSTLSIVAVVVTTIIVNK